MRKVMVFGTFDVFHKGHESYLRQARAHGDYLVAVVALDETVFKLKGLQPQEKQQQRLDKVQHSGLVEKAILGNQGDKYQVLRDYAPDIICLGYDQHGFADQLQDKLKELGLEKTKIVRMKPFEPEIYKSSKLRD